MDASVQWRAPNLVELKNRKKLSIRPGQFFDYYLKDARPVKWIKDGLPGTERESIGDWKYINIYQQVLPDFKKWYQVVSGAFCY